MCDATCGNTSRNCSRNRGLFHVSATGLRLGNMLFQNYRPLAETILALVNLFFFFFLLSERTLIRPIVGRNLLNSFTEDLL